MKSSRILFSENAPFHGTQCTANDPHSNAVVDLDGDCLAGLVPFACGTNFYIHAII